MSMSRVQASRDDYGKLAELVFMGAEVIGFCSCFAQVLEKIKGNGEVNGVSCPNQSQELEFEQDLRHKPKELFLQ